MSIIPLPWRLLIMAAIIAAVWTVGYHHGTYSEGLKKDEEIAENREAFAVRIKASDDALLAANTRASEASNGATVDQSKIDDAYKKGKFDEAAAAKTRVADYTSGRQRVRVDAVCTSNAGSRSAVPGIATAPSGPDGAAAGYAELSPAAAGRFEAAASQTIGDLRQQVIRLQGIAQSEHDRCNQGNAPAPVAPVSQADDVAHKRRILGLGVPNPFGKN